MESEPIPNNHESKSSTPRSKEDSKKELIKQDSEMHIENYLFENKDIESACENFIESLFLVDPKKYDSLGQSHLIIKKLADTSRSNLQSSRQKVSLENSPNIRSQEQLNKDNKENLDNNNSNYNTNKINNQSNQKDDLNSLKDNSNENFNKINSDEQNDNQSNSNINNIKKLNLNQNVDSDIDKNYNNNEGSRDLTNRLNNNNSG